MPTSDSHLETRIDWLHAPEVWVVFLVIVPAVLLAAWWVYRKETLSFAPWKRLLLTGLRALALLCIIAFLFEPLLIRERVQTESSYILVLIDDSFSMTIADRYSDAATLSRLETVVGKPFGDNTTRLEQVVGVLENSQVDVIDKLRRKGNVRVMRFSGELRQVCDLPRLEEGASSAPGDLDLSALKADGKVTRIGDAISDAVNELRGEIVSAVVVLTDGRDNGGILQPEEAAQRLRDVPIYTVGVGNAEEPRDIRVFGLDIAEVVLEKDLVSVDFNIVAKGFSGQVKVELSLLSEDGSPAQRPDVKFVSLSGGEDPQPVRIEFRPRQPGKFLCRVEVPYQEGELFEENNYDEKPITVLSEKIKVLYVDGPPRYEYRFLNHYLIRDPNMETHVLLASADPQRPQNSSAGLRPLDRFPVKKEQLFEYHVVLIGDVHPDFFSRRQKEWLVEFVDDIGGGVVFLSGMWHMPQSYRGDPLERLFPIELEDANRSFYSSDDLVRDFNVVLTPEGRQHPIMQLVADPQQNSSLWEATGATYTLPGFYWYLPVKGLERGAIALAVHPELPTIRPEPRPIFAYQYQGRGRTFISLTDETWRWRRGVGNKWFSRFWGQAIRFVSAGRLLGEKKRFSVSTDQRAYTLGADAQILVRVLNQQFKPLKEEQYEVFIERVDPPGEGRQRLSAIQLPGRPEFFETTLEASELGDHRVWIEHLEKEVASTTFRVVVPQLEYAEPRMDRSRLKRIAGLSGGTYHDLDEIGSLADSVAAYERTIAVPAENKPLWDAQALLLLFVALLAIEWVLRKVFRLV